MGAEGLELVPGRDLLIGDSRDELVSAALAAIRRPEELTETAESGRRQVLARYSWELLAERLDDVWASARGRRGDRVQAALPSRECNGNKWASRGGGSLVGIVCR